MNRDRSRTEYIHCSLGPWLPAHGRVEGGHGEGGRGVDVAGVGVHVGLLGAGVSSGVLDSWLDIHHLHGQIVELLLRRHPVAVEPVLADVVRDDVRVQVGRHARAGAHLHVLHRTQVACEFWRGGLVGVVIVLGICKVERTMVKVIGIMREIQI